MLIPIGDTFLNPLNVVFVTLRVEEEKLEVEDGEDTVDVTNIHISLGRGAVQVHEGITIDEVAAAISEGLVGIGAKPLFQIGDAYVNLDKVTYVRTATKKGLLVRGIEKLPYSASAVQMGFVDGETLPIYNVALEEVVKAINEA